MDCTSRPSSLRSPTSVSSCRTSGLTLAGIGSALVLHFLDRWEEDEVFTALLCVGVPIPRVRSGRSNRSQRRVCPDPVGARPARGAHGLADPRRGQAPEGTSVLAPR